MVKYDGNLNYQWAKVFKSVNSNSIRDLDLDKNNNIWIAGTFSDSIDLDPGPTYATFHGIEDGDSYLVMLDELGNYLQGGSLVGSGLDEITAIEVSETNNIYITGRFEEDTDIDLDSLNSHILTEVTFFVDGFVAKYDSTLKLSWVRELKGNGSEINTDLHLDDTENVYLYGWMSNSL